MAQKKFDFQKQLDQLEKITEELSEGELPLEGAIDKYARGIKTFKACSDYLSAAEKKVTKMTQGLDGTPHQELFEDQDSFDGSDVKE